MMLIKILAVDGQHSNWLWSEPITTCFFIAFAFVRLYLYGIVKTPGKDKKSGKSWKSTGNLFFRVVRHPVYSII